MTRKFPKGNKKEVKRITHPEILRAERLGSRDKELLDCGCTVCGGEDKGDGFVSGMGEFFCSEKCRENYIRGRLK